MSTWKPQPSDIAWMRNLLAGLNNGGYWAIPVNLSIWKHDQTNRVLVCVHGEHNEMFDRITVVCRELGYTTTLALEAFTTEQVQQHLTTTAPTTTAFTADMFGSGKTLVHTSRQPGIRYLFRPLTAEDQATFRINLAKLPKRLRWKGKLTPQCDFCANDRPLVTYAAHRLTTGQVVDCWRWLACADCHEAITQNDFKTVERRACRAFGRNVPQPEFNIKLALMAFHADAVQL